MRDPEPSETLPDWLRSVKIGSGTSFGSLTVAPVFQQAALKAPRYRVLSDALATREISISELPEASVPTLKLENRCALPVLILDGEEVVGGLQNRVVNTTLLVPAKTTFDLPVTCIEHGRWRPARAAQDPASGRAHEGFAAGEAVYPSLRRAKTEQVAASLVAFDRPIADQHAVWEEVEARHQVLNSHSPTGALNDAYVGRARDLASMESHFVCPEGAVGVAAAIGGAVSCLDLFDCPTILRAYWNRLIRSFAIEALSVEQPSGDSDSSKDLLRRSRAATVHAFKSPGLGWDMRLSGDRCVGAALVYEERPVHAALFATESHRSAGRGPSEFSLRRPGLRRQFASWTRDDA